MNETLFFAIQIDCESTQHALKNPALGERAIRGLGDVFAQTGTKGTFFVIPGDIEVHAAIYKELEKQGHEVGLHVHAADQGYGEFLGDQSAEAQRTILAEAMDRFAQAMGRKPQSFCPGYLSANDFTFGILEELGFTHGTVSCPTRNLPQCACVWGNSPLDPRYPHRYNRVLNGDVNFVDLPLTVDPESRMWGGGHPLDLRVELVDAKNHWYTIDKSVRRQLSQNTPIKQLHAVTHNVFEFSDAANFRRETYVGIVKAARDIAAREKLEFRAATLAEVAAAYRKAVPFEKAAPATLKLDTRGRSAANASR
jgi:peptidoglycan/xylan/chitin deacetylase (PgdA/CDA1 family)